MYNEIFYSLPMRFREEAKGLKSLYELRIYKGEPIIAVTDEGIKKLRGEKVSSTEFEKVLDSLCRGSQYLYEEQMANGFFTIEGCRIGLCGTAIKENGRVVSVKAPRSMNIRFAKEVLGCGEELFLSLGRSVKGGVLLAGAPACGKTTLLRDLARLISNSGKKVCIIDERSEIAAISEGASPMQLGNTTDVLDGYPKKVGAEIALRCLSPNVIIFDELGEAQKGLLASCANCGVDLVASVHSDGMLSKRIHSLTETGAFRKLALFKNDTVGKIERIVELSNVQTHIGSYNGCGDISSRSS